MRKALHAIILPCIAASLLAGCASFQPKPLSPEQTASAFESRSLDNPELRDFVQKNLPQDAVSWPPKAWDLTLFTLAAFYYHPDLDVARAKWDVAKAGMLTAGMRPNPGAGVSAQKTTNAPADVSPWTYGWNLDIPLETAGKRGYRIAEAGHLTDAARAGIADAAWRVRSRVRTAMLGLYAANESVVLLQRQEASLSDIVRLLDRKFQAGEASSPDVAQARITLQQTRLALDEARKQEAEARAKLAAAIGVPVASLEHIAVSFDGFGGIPNPDELPPAEVRRRALVSRADIAAALADYEASQSALQLAVAKQYPDISLGPGYQWDQGAIKWSLALSLTLPLLNRNEGPIAEAEARRAQAAASFASLQARVAGELDLALAAYRAVSRKLLTAAQLLGEQEKRQASLTAQFRAGEIDRLALAEGAFERISAQRARLDALVQGQQSLGALEDAVQRPLSPAFTVPAIATANPRNKEAQQ